MDHLFNTTDDTKDKDKNGGIDVKNNQYADYTPTPDKDYKDDNEPTGSDTKISKIEIRLDGSLSDIFTKALMDVMNKTEGLNEYQVLNTKEIKEKVQKTVKKGKLSNESQQQFIDDIATTQYLNVNKDYYNNLDDESVDPDYYYNYIGKNTDINNSDDVIKTINRILNGYNKKYLENNSVVLENNGIINKHVIDLECMLDTFNLKLVITSRDKILGQLKFSK